MSSSIWTTCFSHYLFLTCTLLLLLLTAIGFLPGGSVQYASTKKHKHYIRRRRRKTIKQTYNTIRRNRKDKKQPYRTKNKHKTSNTNLQDNKITY
jgi:hypothetical protein